MSKQKKDRRIPDDHVEATLSMIRISPQKLNLVAKAVRGMSVDKAMKTLSFLPKKGAFFVQKVLKSVVWI